MKSSIAQRTLGIIFCSMLLGLAPAAQARECTASSVAGIYGYTSSGTIVTPAVGPFVAVGRVTFTSTGILSGTQTTSIAGNVFVDEFVQGTFTVKPDCTGTLDVYIYHGSTLVRTSQVDMVWDDHQKEARGIFLKAGTAITIIGRKISGNEPAG
jgi:hypothetical protein